MKTYICTVKETYEMDVVVQADTIEEAERKARFADLYRGDFKYLGRTAKYKGEWKDGN